MQYSASTSTTHLSSFLLTTDDRVTDNKGLIQIVSGEPNHTTHQKQ